MKLTTTTRNLLITLGSLAAVIATGLAVYGYILQLPLHGDDLWHFATLPTGWRDTIISWRPIQTITFKLMTLFTGHPEAYSLHILCLVLHILNCCLVYAIILELNLPHRKWIALSSAILVMVYPFSVEVIVWVAALNHLLNTFFVLASVALYQRSRRSGPDAGWLTGGSLVCALLAPFANESGVVIFILLALILWSEYTPIRSRAWFSLLPYLACAVVGSLMLRLALPHDDQLTRWTFILADWAIKIPYLLQSIAYPFAPIVAWLYRLGISSDPYLFSALIYGVLLSIYLYLLNRWHLMRFAILAVGWFIIAFGPAIVIQYPAYILYGPRLLYLSSFGAGLFWALPLAAPSTYKRRAFVLAAGAFVLAVALSSLPYIDIARNLGLEVRKIVDRLEVTLEGVSGNILCVNFPSNLGKQSPYLLGGYTARVLPHRVDSDLSDLLYFNQVKRLPIRNFDVRELDDNVTWKFTRGRVNFKATVDDLQPLLREQQHIYMAQPLDTINLREAGNLEATAIQPSSSYSARFDELIALLDIQTVPGEHEWQVTLRWQCWQPPIRDIMVLVHIYDSADRLISIQDAYPLLGMSRTDTWQAGDIWRDVHYLRIPPELAPGEYTITIGLYYPADLSRPQAFDQGGQRLVWDEVIVGELTLP